MQKPHRPLDRTWSQGALSRGNDIEKAGSVLEALVELRFE